RLGDATQHNGVRGRATAEAPVNAAGRAAVAQDIGRRGRNSYRIDSDALGTGRRARATTQNQLQSEITGPCGDADRLRSRPRTERRAVRGANKGPLVTRGSVGS